jgi:LacI family transcriptional regulator
MSRVVFVRKMQKSRRRVVLPRRRQVAVLVDFSRSYGRGLLTGVAKFVREHHEWSVQSEEWRWTDATPAWFKHWKGDGALAWVETPELADTARALGVPVVDVRGSVPNCGLPLIATENKTVVGLVAEHFIQRGFRHYAFCGFVGANYSDQRSRLFQERLAEAGFECALYSPPETSRDAQVIELEKRGLLFQEHLSHWLKSLPKPVGVMACNDIRGHQIVNACRRANLSVPEEVAVVGVDNDEIFCELCDPPLTSVALNTVQIGYEATALLERIMAGGKSPDQPIRLPPLGIVTRRSSDVLAMSDRQLAAGTRYMREHAFQGININDVARAAGMSRRVFERRFVAQVGRAPKAEILRLRLEQVKDLLAGTDWTLAQIAERTGFKYSEYLHTVFSQKVGLSPGRFRARVKQLVPGPHYSFWDSQVRLPK